MHMKPSRVLKALREGKIVSCIKINLQNAQVTEIAAMSGFDCVWIDQEHAAGDWSVINSQIWSTKLHGADILVRVPRGSYSDLVRPLEMDATGIMVPHVMSLADAADIVRKTRFHPIGRRAIDGGNADGAYTNVDFHEYLLQANRERFVVLQIEDPEPLEELDAIAALPGYDMLFFGPGDFSQGIGAPGQWDHPALIAARKQVAAVARKHGKFAGTVGGPGNLEALTQMGYQFISVGADVVGLSAYFKGLAEVFDKDADKESGSGMDTYK